MPVTSPRYAIMADSALYRTAWRTLMPDFSSTAKSPGKVNIRNTLRVSKHTGVATPTPMLPQRDPAGHF